MTVTAVLVPPGISLNPPLPSLHLRPGTVRILTALIETIAPCAPEVVDRDARIISFVSSALAHLPPMLRFLLPLGLWLFELGTVLFGFAPRRFSALSRERRRHYMHSWMRSRFALKRQLARGLRALIQLGFYDMPEVRSHLGYEPEGFVAARVQQRATRQGEQSQPLVDEPHLAQLEPLVAANDLSPARQELAPTLPAVRFGSR